MRNVVFSILLLLPALVAGCVDETVGIVNYDYAAEPVLPSGNRTYLYSKLRCGIRLAKADTSASFPVITLLEHGQSNLIYVDDSLYIGEPMDYPYKGKDRTLWFDLKATSVGLDTIVAILLNERKTDTCVLPIEVCEYAYQIECESPDTVQLNTRSDIVVEILTPDPSAQSSGLSAYYTFIEGTGKFLIGEKEIRDTARIPLQLGKNRFGFIPTSEGRGGLCLAVKTEVGSDQEVRIEYLSRREEEYYVTCRAVPPEGGTVIGGGLYKKESYATFHATPAAGYELEGYYEGTQLIDRNPRITIKVEEDRRLEARFRASTQEYDVTIEAAPAAGGVVTGGGHYRIGRQVSLLATAEPGYRFVGWFEGDQASAPHRLYEFILDRDRHLIGKFEQSMEVRIEATAVPLAGGQVTGTGEYINGTICTLSAIAQAGYRFAGWYENAIPVGNGSVLSFTVNGHRWLEARFNRER